MIIILLLLTLFTLIMTKIILINNSLIIFNRIKYSAYLIYINIYIYNNITIVVLKTTITIM